MALWTAVLGVALGIIARFGPIEPGWALRIFIVWIGVLVVVTGMRSLLQVAPAQNSMLEAWMNRRSPGHAHPQRLIELERLVEFSNLNAFDLNYRLRTVLRQIAVERLARRGLTLNDNPARVVLGHRSWSFLAPPKGASMPAEGPGWKPHEIADIVDAVEKL